MIRAALILCVVLIATILFATATVQEGDLMRAKDVASAVGPYVTFGSVAVGFFVGYVTWLSPFRLQTTARPYTWRIDPPHPDCRGLNIVFWLSLSNEGARAGYIDDLAIQVVLPRGRWFLQPLAFLKPDDAFALAHGKTFEHPPYDGPFHPVFLGPRTQVHKTILFMPQTAADFDIELMQPGHHELRLFARTNGGRLKAIAVQSLVIPDDVFADWKAGKQVAGMVNHRDTQLRDLLPPA